MVTLICAAILPFLAVIAAGVAFSYDEADRAARRNVAPDAQLSAAKLSRVFLDAKVVLGTLGGMPALQTSNRPRCDSFVQKVHANQKMFVTMGILDVDGNIACHNKADAVDNFGDPELTQRWNSSSPTRPMRTIQTIHWRPMASRRLISANSIRAKYLANAFQAHGL